MITFLIGTLLGGTIGFFTAVFFAGLPKDDWEDHDGNQKD